MWDVFVCLNLYLLSMILLTKGSVADIAIHLDDLKSSSEYDYRFEFTNDMTKDVVAFNVTNISQYPKRYLEFNVAVNTYFLNELEGFWTYRIYEYNEEPLIKNLLKLGKMKLIGQPFDFTSYDGQDEEFITYNE